jgi:hypothetical protein
MLHYYFDIKDGHKLVEPSRSEFKNDDAAIAKAQEFHPATQVRLS